MELCLLRDGLPSPRSWMEAQLSIPNRTPQCTFVISVKSLQLLAAPSETRPVFEGPEPDARKQPRLRSRRRSRRAIAAGDNPGRSPPAPQPTPRGRLGGHTQNVAFSAGGAASSPGPMGAHPARSPRPSVPAPSTYLRELPGVWAAEERGAGAEADGPSAAEDVLRHRPVEGQHRQLAAYFH